ncbi:MAG: hypothetical protein U5K30_16135 [Acidimicrobiales bacterium]|nr:hypothetical protein [Acidimicrobiales bacterium]
MDQLDPEAIESFATRLRDHADDLDDRERRLLEALLLRAMTPLQRRSLTDTTDHFSKDELELLDRLDGGD